MTQTFTKTRTANYVVGFMFSPDKSEVLMIQKARPEWQKGRMNGIGGHIEPGETPQLAMCREFDEETGLCTLPSHWQEFLELGNGDFKVHFFRCFTTIEGQKPHNRDLEEPVSWLKTEHLYAYKTINNLRWIIPLALDGTVLEKVIVVSD